jgi:hypothetical protein
MKRAPCFSHVKFYFDTAFLEGFCITPFDMETLQEEGDEAN